MIDKRQLSELYDAESRVKRLAAQFKLALKGQKNVDLAESILDEFQEAVYELLEMRDRARAKA